MYVYMYGMYVWIFLSNSFLLNEIKNLMSLSFAHNWKMYYKTHLYCVCFCVLYVIKVVISLRGLEVTIQHILALYLCNGKEIECMSVWETREWERGKVAFQQILDKIFHSSLPLSTLFKCYSLPVRSSRPFESLSRWRGWNASPTRLWLMFKEEIMEMQCHDHTGENQKCFLLWENMTK